MVNVLTPALAKTLNFSLLDSYAEHADHREALTSLEVPDVELTICIIQ